jgi:pimeloyl-ACP methyl ester carboxylesterase
MSLIERPDGVLLHWEARGDGPPLVFLQPIFSTPEVYDGLLGDLSSDHTVVLFDPRGAGRSSRSGPYDLGTDSNDLVAVLEEVGGPATLLASGETIHRAVRAAAARPELVSVVINPGATPVGHQGDYSASSGLAGSRTVIDAFFQLISSDYRAGLRSGIASANSQLDDEGLRSRVERTIEYAPREATLGRLEAWIEADSTAEARALGDRLWLLAHGHNDWFPSDMAQMMRSDMPEAQFREIELGPLSDPATTAALVRRAEAAAGVSARGC